MEAGLHDGLETAEQVAQPDWRHAVLACGGVRGLGGMVAATMPQTVALVVALILQRPLCISCVATKTGAASAVVLNVALTRISEVLKLNREHDRCRSCGIITTVLSVERPE